MPPLVAVFSLIAAVLYTFGVLCLKRATRWHPGPWKVTFVCNLATTVLFFPLLLLDGPPIDWSLIWQPFICAVLFVGGQVLVVIALTRGDVSIATPLMGLKILMVTLITIAVSGADSIEGLGSLLMAALLATIAVGLLGTGGERHRRSNLIETVITSIAAAGCYAAFDVGLQSWGRDWGATRLMPVVMILQGLLSLCLIPMFRGSLRTIERAAWPSIGIGAFIMALQACFLTMTMAAYGYAPEANVVFSTRGLWTVLLIWCLGHWFSKEEQNQGRRVMTRRLIGAALMSIAVLLVI